MIVVFEQSYAGRRDDSETISRIECGETDDKAIEERLILIFKRYLISNIDFLLSILLLFFSVILYDFLTVKMMILLQIDRMNRKDFQSYHLLAHCENYWHLNFFHFIYLKKEHQYHDQIENLSKI